MPMDCLSSGETAPNDCRLIVRIFVHLRWSFMLHRFLKVIFTSNQELPQELSDFPIRLWRGQAQFCQELREIRSNLQTTNSSER